MLAANEITQKIIGCAISVHSQIGPGLLESTYQKCLQYKMIKSGLFVETEVVLPVIFEGVKLDCNYRIDIIVERLIILEIKAVDCLLPIHTAQILTYLKLSGMTIGLLINFNQVRVKEGIKRVVNNF